MTQPNDDLNRSVDDLWSFTERLVRLHMQLLGADDVESGTIARDIRKRLSVIDKLLPRNGSDEFYRAFAALICAATTAEQRRVAAKSGRMPGQLLGDWPPTPIGFEHPFLQAVQRIVGELEADANKAENGRRLH